MSRYGTDTKIICLFLLQLCDLITPFRGCLCFCLFKFLILAVLDLVFLRPRRLFPCKDDSLLLFVLCFHGRDLCRLRLCLWLVVPNVCAGSNRRAVGRRLRSTSVSTR